MARPKITLVLCKNEITRHIATLLSIEQYFIILYTMLTRKYSTSIQTLENINARHRTTL